MGLLKHKQNGGSYDIAKRKRIKVKENCRKVFEFYKSFQIFENEKYEKEISIDENGYTALECFYQKDAYGEILPCSEPEILKRVLCGKEQINIQIEIWSDSLIEQPFTIFEFREIIKMENYPEWVLESVLQQTRKRLGYCPTYLT